MSSPVTEMLSENGNISGRQLRYAAQKYADDHYITGFRSNKGWLIRFSQRHDLGFNVLQGKIREFPWISRAMTSSSRELGNNQPTVIRVLFYVTVTTLSKYWEMTRFYTAVQFLLQVEEQVLTGKVFRNGSIKLFRRFQRDLKWRIYGIVMSLDCSIDSCPINLW